MLQALPPPRLPPTWGEYPPSPPVIIDVVVGGGIPSSLPCGNGCGGGGW